MNGRSQIRGGFSKSQAVREAAEHAMAEIEQYEEPASPRVNEFDEPDTD